MHLLARTVARQERGSGVFLGKVSGAELLLNDALLARSLLPLATEREESKGPICGLKVLLMVAIGAASPEAGSLLLCERAGW